MKYITVENLSIGYNGHKVIENLNFYVEENDYLCIVGENGVGKSTLIKTLLKLIPSIEGTIKYNAEQFKYVGYLPQKQETQSDFPASVMEVVLSGFVNKLGFRPFYNKAEKEIAIENLKRLNIDHLVKKSFNQLSGGQQQRVLIARALCSTQKILLLDEPYASLDIDAEKELYNIIKQLNNEGTTIIMITHNFELMKDCSNKILEIKKDGAKIYQESEFKEFYLKRGLIYG